MLSQAEIDQQLNKLPGWAVKEGKLHKQFEFSDFIQAFSFMTKVALKAEKLDHHPEWSNCYNTVTVDLVTHSAQSITQLDFELAEFIEAAL
jgi:4a-hydroxytetrahydrobiopterin dehydratase